MGINENLKYKRLKTFNAVMGVFHFIQFALIMILSNDITTPITTSYLKFDPSVDALVLTTDKVVDIRLGPLVALFLLISAIAHFSLASPLGYPWYVRNLKKHINYARWYEYALSSSVMIVVIAMLVGVYDLSALIPLFGINACMNLFGLMMELHNQTTKETNWIAYYFGVFAGLIPWVVIGIQLYGSSVAAAGAIPDFVYWIFASIAFFYFTFAFNMVLQYKQVGRWKDYLYGERMYIILSLVSKTALAWQVFGGTLRPV